MAVDLVEPISEELVSAGQVDIVVAAADSAEAVFIDN